MGRLGTVAIGLNGEELNAEGLRRARKRLRDTKFVPRIVADLVGEECRCDFVTDLSKEANVYRTRPYFGAIVLFC